MHMLYPSLLRCTLLGTSLSLLTACADNHAASQVETPTPVVQSTSSLPTATVSTSKAATFEQPNQSFASWQAAFRQEALSAGIQAAVFDAAFAGVSPDPAIICADRSQPEFTRPVWEYLDSAISASRVRRGQALLAEHASTLQAIEQRYGVDRRALVAIWGMESNFGQYMGDKSVIAALATLAYEGRRPAFAHEQLLAALRILQHGDVQPSRMRGSWAGAMGQTQFIPSTYNQFAVDFDGDGRRDIWEWRQLGVNNIPAANDQANAVLLLPAGHRGPAFLVLDNFRAILKYNNSTAYGLAIGLLSGALDGQPGVHAAWPRSDRQLGRSERIELQELLTSKGYAPGAADGIIGANTRKAVRAFQQSLGQPADGYPSLELLQQLR
jgi:membrane-bound lytic murein transglycosylase B